MEPRRWNVYLSGEIHTPWRDEIAEACARRDIPVRLMGPELDHAKSDGCGDAILGEEPNAFWSDHRAAKINAIRTRGVMRNCDLVIVKFGEQYKQWNAAFDAGQAAAWGKSLVIIHPPAFDHALKEVDAAALAVCREPGQAVDILEYVTSRPF